MRFSLSALSPSLPLSDEVRRRLNQPWVIVAVLLLPPLLAASVYFALARAERTTEAKARALQAQIKQRLAQLGSAPATANTPYAELLPVEPYPVARAVEHLRAAAQSQAVNVVTLSANERAATPATMGRVTLDFTLRGGYVAIKAVLNELLARDAQRVVLQQLSLRRSAVNPTLGAPTSSADLEAQVSVNWLHRPLAAGNAVGLSKPATNASPPPAAASAASAQPAPLPAKPTASSASTASLPSTPSSAASAAVRTSRPSSTNAGRS
ncbi:hypothetical protein OU995_23225 [Roseateles sp. SL47]|uniref:hypothetical protein n=1 Tax=Roseateles sp. SL47 TaxID=2995138 RepID=UPI00226E59A4|nr:hypothetical protein [Roseateles sp. SL47]WAC72433.1 hypothetical protein OU995_23225 [Roseateles sp. SL47]